MRQVILLACLSAVCSAQQNRPATPLARTEWTVTAAHQTTDGRITHAQGHVELFTTDLRFHADAVDMDEAKTTAHLVGHVTVEIPNKGTFTADEADYDLASGDLSLKLKLTPAH